MNLIPARTPELLARFIRELDLQPPADSPGLWLYPIILPTVDVIKGDMVVANVTLDLSAASAWSIFIPAFTVPDNKRWVVHGISRDVFSADAYGIEVRKRNAGTGGTTDPNAGVLIGPASTVKTQAKDMQSFRMESGWALGVYNTANVGDTARRMYIMYEEFDA